ncbi:anthocyanidin 5,3-O-glucosyltransferase-like protein [Carex littledalei]|uniref:Anthocyanidin 5,3-O-glucosyltransferase-like protein n=1 Tax=Carex littledalei TaxID=544730 RepID=A0A833RDA5_9POAL|nr:anthocyanidin 5,3-O-glucosyltransferase-like protein [Carex littledalei]
MKSKKVILYPSVFVGHIVPMVELAKQFVGHGISVTIPVMNVGSAPDLVSEICCNSNHPNISFHILPQIVTPLNPHPVPSVNLFNMMKLNNDSFRSFLIEQSRTSPISGVILDIICVDALDVIYELGIPAYFFMASSAANLAVNFQLPTYFTTRSIVGPLKDIGKTPLLFHGVPPLTASHLPSKQISFQFTRPIIHDSESQ